MDRFRIDSHKLNYHPGRVSAWKRGENVYPIYMEISPIGACNHRCTFCGLDFMEYKNRSLDTRLLVERLAELGELGLKSVMYAGEGEPLLHKDMPTIAEKTKESGIDVAFTTNAVPLTAEKAERIIPVSQWIKVSLNAGTAATYATIHRTKESDFERVFANLATARIIREKTKSDCTMGVQIILLEENLHEVVTLAERVRDMGLDYLVVKPYSQHPQSVTERKYGIDHGSMEKLADKLNLLATDTFQAIFRTQAMEKVNEEVKPYTECLALPFWSYIDAGGGVWGCSVFLGDDRFYYGSIVENSFREIWEGERRRKSLAFVREKLDASQCRTNCRMDKVNLFLRDLSNPPDHVNFI